MSALLEKATAGVTASATKDSVAFHFKVKEDGFLLESLCKQFEKLFPKNEIIRSSATIKIFFNPVGRPAMAPQKRKVNHKPRGGVIKKLTRGGGYMRAA